ncbi:hypothetical protein [Maribellus maritimus]|uniref:hypothetical protein n=1 Tax=Maribellus maritimus TaxID=2870838 RepID=UPI001EEC23B9|nr:hypothetical protein [Maribellus maritimus]MCG6191262.1 hypothetical protein [Maribellus maritimus]
MKRINKNTTANKVPYLRAGVVVRNCIFSFSSSVSFGQERSSKSAPQHTPTLNEQKDEV